MPDIGTKNQLYGTDTLPASSWAVGKDEANEILSGKKTKKTNKKESESTDEVVSSEEDGPLND